MQTFSFEEVVQTQAGSIVCEHWAMYYMTFICQMFL